MSTTSPATALATRTQGAAAAFLSEAALADAIVTLDAAVSGSLDAQEGARSLLQQAGCNPESKEEMHELLGALTSRLAEMTQGRSTVFEDALSHRSPEERFSLPGLAEALWPALENVRKSAPGAATQAAIQAEVAAHIPQLAALYKRHSGRSQASWDATRHALLHRLPALFELHAHVMDAREAGLLARLAQTPEGVGILAGALGLLTIRMPIPTPLVCGMLFILGYTLVAPVLARLQDGLRTAILDALQAEDAAVARLGDNPIPLRLVDLWELAQPMLTTACLAGANTPEQWRLHLQPLLSQMETQAAATGGPGQAWVTAAKHTLIDKLAPRLCAITVAWKANLTAPLATRFVQDPRGAGLVTMVATLPISVLAAVETPFGMWDFPLMAGLFFLAGRTLSRLLRSRERDLAALQLSVVQEDAVLAGIFAA